MWAPWRGEPPVAPQRLLVELGADVSLLAEPGGATALSRDGRVLAFVAQATPTAPAQLYVRRLEDLQAQALAGTEGAFAPFFSPEGDWIAFFAAGKLKKVSVAGGAVVTLSDVRSARGGSWAEDGTITFTPDIAPGLSLTRVSAAGGKPESLAATPLDDEVTQRWPQVLPGGDALLYTSHNDTRNFDAANLVVRPLRTGEPRIVLRGGYSGRYVSSGHLVYIREGTLLAVPFDIERLETTGPPVPAVEGVAAISRAGGAHFSISDGGTLAYVPGQGVSEQPIMWMDRAGKTSILGQTAEAWQNPQFAPHGRSLALQIGSDRPDVWVYDLARETLSPVTRDPDVDQKPVWTPDSQRITFSSQRDGTLRANLYWQRADSTGEAQRLTTSSNNQMPGSWHPTGRWLAFSGLRRAQGGHHPRNGRRAGHRPRAGQLAARARRRQHPARRRRRQGAHRLRHAVGLRQRRVDRRAHQAGRCSGSASRPARPCSSSTDDDFRKHNLHQLLRHHGPAQKLAHRVFRWMMDTIEYHPGRQGAEAGDLLQPAPRRRRDQHGGHADPPGRRRARGAHRLHDQRQHRRVRSRRRAAWPTW